MVMSEISVDRAAEAIMHYLSTGKGASAVDKAFDFEVKDIFLKARPDAADLPVDPLRSTLRYWQGLPKEKGVAEVERIDPAALLPALGYIMLVDRGEEPNELRYALYGTKIAAVAGFDMTGKSVWQIGTASAIRVFFAACYRVVAELRVPLYTVHKAPPHITASHWHRLILPLGRSGEVRRFLVCNTPIQDGMLI